MRYGDELGGHGKIDQAASRHSALSLISRTSFSLAGLISSSMDCRMVLAPGQGAVQQLAAASPDPRSAIAFIRGVRTLPSTVRIPAPARTASNAAVKLEPR